MYVSMYVRVSVRTDGVYTHSSSAMACHLLPPGHAESTERYEITRRVSTSSIWTNYLGTALLKIGPIRPCRIGQCMRIPYLTPSYGVSKIRTKSLSPAGRRSARAAHDKHSRVRD